MKKIHFPLIVRRVHGASMTPTFQNNTIIIASRWRNLREGQVVVAQYGSSEVIKRIHRLEGATAQLAGDNTDRHHSLAVTQADIMAVVLCQIKYLK